LDSEIASPSPPPCDSSPTTRDQLCRIERLRVRLIDGQLPRPRRDRGRDARREGPAAHGTGGGRRDLLLWRAPCATRLVSLASAARRNLTPSAAMIPHHPAGVSRRSAVCACRRSLASAGRLWQDACLGYLFR
jgi:hypothetical protein